MQSRSNPRLVVAASVSLALLASCVTPPPLVPLAVEPGECEIISRMVPHGDISPVARAAPLYSWVDGRNEGAPRNRANSASLASCRVLAGRLSPTGVDVSRVTFNNDRSRAIIEINCGPAYLEKNQQGSWGVVAVYTSVHGCFDMP